MNILPKPFEFNLIFSSLHNTMVWIMLLLANGATAKSFHPICGHYFQSYFKMKTSLTSSYLNMFLQTWGLDFMSLPLISILSSSKNTCMFVVVVVFVAVGVGSVILLNVSYPKTARPLRVDCMCSSPLLL